MDLLVAILLQIFLFAPALNYWIGVPNKDDALPFSLLPVNFKVGVC